MSSQSFGLQVNHSAVPTYRPSTLSSQIYSEEIAVDVENGLAMKSFIPIWAFLILLTSSVLGQDTATLLIGGQRAGPFLIGSAFSEVVARLGQPSASQPTSGDPGTTFRAYKDKQIAFLVNPDSQVIGITIARKDWKTVEGLGVGSPVLAFQELYGKGLKRGNGQIAFPEAGIAVTHQSGVVELVYVVKIDQVDAVKGDHLLVGGSRAGQLRLGQSNSDMLKLLGPPSQKSGPEENIWTYPDRGIRLGFIQGRLHMVGVTSGDWVTPSGLKVGRPFSDMKRELGGSYRIDQSSVFYDSWGIGARLQGDQIVEILIFNPKQAGRQG